MIRCIHLSSLIALFIGVLLAPFSSSAGGTKIWELAGFDELDQGETDGTIVSSKGEVSLGYRDKKLGLEDIGLVWSAVKGKNGTVYLGTGYDGKIFRVRANSVEEIATTGQLVVTSLALDKKGTLFAATLPDAVIWKIDSPEKIDAKKPVKATKWVTLPAEAEHVFAIEFDLNGKTLFAGTGPTGQLFAVGRDKKVSLYLDTEEEHILCIAARDKNKIVIGTSPGAMLLEVSGPGRAKALADFEGTEVKAVVARKGDLFAAVNTFKKPPAVPKKTGTSTSMVNGSKSSKKTSSKKNKGTGKIYRVSKSGKLEELLEQKKSHVVSLAVSEKSGELFVGFGAEGKVMALDSDRVTKTVLDLDERQVTAIIAMDDLAFVATGDTGAIYAVSTSAKADALYYSPPLDAKAISKWGLLTWYATGALKVQSRSGNTKLPGTNWSDWSKPISNGSLPSSPPAKYLQLRFSWAKNATTKLVSTELAFRPQNERAEITKFDPSSPFPKTKSKRNDNENYVSKRIAKALKMSNDKELDLSWTVSNPDGDTLRYQLWYRAVGTELWRPITKDDKILTIKRYTWMTRSIPEGRYQLRLRADDSPDNDHKETLEDETISVPVLVDNHQPEVLGLKSKGSTLNGSAKDSFSAISHLEFSVDAGPWKPIFSVDGIFDETKEDFQFDLPKDLESGPHAIAVRAFDRAGNMGSAEIHVETENTDR